MHADKAEALFAQNFNCAQAVFGAYAEELGMDAATAMKTAATLGGGLAHTGEVCGAALGMCLALGLSKGYDSAPDQAAKDALSATVKELMQRFKAEFGSGKCDDLRVPGDRSICTNIVRRAAELVEKEIAF